MTRSEDKNTDAQFSTTPKWSVSQRQHFSQKSYGTNPYSLASQRSAQQRAYREQRAAAQRVDVKGRVLSNTRKWRPGRLEGDLSGDLEFLETEAALEGEILEELNQE